MSELNLFQRMQAVSMEVMNIEKDMQVGSGNYGYKAVSDNAVTLAVKKAEKKHGIISIPIKQERLSGETVKQVKNNKESILHIDNVKMTVVFINLDKPEERLEIESLGKGLDSGDKGFGKASTYARKYALLNAYKIVTGEDPDANKSEETQVISEDEKKNAVVNYCMQNESVKNGVLSHFALGSLDDLSKEEINKVYKQFKTKKYI